MHLLLNASIILIRMQNFMEFFKNFNKNSNGKSIRWLEFISLLLWPKSLKNYIVVWPDGLHSSLPNIFSFFTMYSMQKLLKVYELFLWNHHFFLARIVIIFCLLLTKSKKNIGLIFKNHFSTVSTYHALSILNAVISTNERHWIITDHVTFKLCYNQI